MPQYQVPQFIDIEDKVFGPLTIKQFLYVAAGGGLTMLIYTFFKGWVVLVLGVPIGLFVAALAFYRPNGLPFPKMVKSFVYYALSKKLYLWKKRDVQGSAFPELDIPFPTPTSPTQQSPFAMPTQHKRKAVKLEDLAWSLDVQHEPPK